MKSFGGLEAGGPQNGTQAHDTSRELESGRPARVGATPFWEPPASKPCTLVLRIRTPFRGQQTMNNQQQ